MPILDVDLWVVRMRRRSSREKSLRSFNFLVPSLANFTRLLNIMNIAFENLAIYFLVFWGAESKSRVKMIESRKFKIVHYLSNFASSVLDPSWKFARLRSCTLHSDPVMQRIPENKFSKNTISIFINYIFFQKKINNKIKKREIKKKDFRVYCVYK